jgi:hypothetical protein
MIEDQSEKNGRRSITRFVEDLNKCNLVRCRAEEAIEV